MRIHSISARGRYLIVRDDVTELGQDTEARILDLEQETLFWWSNVHSIFAHTHEEWSEYRGSQELLDSLLEQVDELAKPG